jgi:hypothetical protein
MVWLSEGHAIGVIDGYEVASSGLASYVFAEKGEVEADGIPAAFFLV